MWLWFGRWHPAILLYQKALRHRVPDKVLGVLPQRTKVSGTVIFIGSAWKRFLPPFLRPRHSPVGPKPRRRPFISGEENDQARSTYMAAKRSSSSRVGSEGWAPSSVTDKAPTRHAWRTATSSESPRPSPGQGPVEGVAGGRRVHRLDRRLGTSGVRVGVASRAPLEPRVMTTCRTPAASEFRRRPLGPRPRRSTDAGQDLRPRFRWASGRSRWAKRPAGRARPGPG